MDEAVDEGSARLVTTQAAEENTSAHSEEGLFVVMRTGTVRYLRVTISKRRSA